MDKEYILVIDQGTTGTRAVIYDDEALQLGYSYRKHRQITPRPGWVEHDPMEIWENTRIVIREAIVKTGIDPSMIRAIGITNQRETTILWDRETGKPVYNAIVWQDTRTIKYCEELRRKGYAGEIHGKTGLPVSTYFSATKIKWILERIPVARKLLREDKLLFGTIDTWIVWNLTKGTKNNITPERGGSHVTDPSNASRTMLYNINTGKWDDQLLELFNIPRSILPVVVDSSSWKPLGYMNKEIIGYEIPLHGIIGDQQSALVGQTCFKPGELKVTYGTGSFLLLNTGIEPRYSKHGLITTIAYKFSGEPLEYAVEGSIAVSGAAVEWLKDIGLIKNPGETEKLAVETRGAGSGGVFFVPAFSGLYAPYWNLYARGLFIGLTRYTRRKHLVHAVLESIAWRVRDVIDAMIKDTGLEPEQLRVDGGVSRNNYLLQLQADTLGIPVERPVNIETTSLGAAFAAGLGAGIWKNTNELAGLRRIDKIFKPVWSSEKREKLYNAWKQAVKRALDWLKDTGEIPSSYAYEP